MASTALKGLYREARKAQVGCIVGEHALSAWRAAKILRKWDALETIGAVRLISQYDDDDYDTNEPAYGVVGQYRTDFDHPDWYPGDVFDDDLPWENADSVWGNIGHDDVTDWRENPYVIDIMAETIEAFKDEWKRYLSGGKT